jgi:hypothetical protein
MDSSQVWVCLQQRVSKDVLIKRWKRRALFLLGRCYVGLLEFKLALNSFKAALALIKDDPSLVKECKDIRTLISTTTKKLEKETKNEKQMWSKAFEKQKAEETEIEKSASASPSPQRTASPLSPSPSPVPRYSSNSSGVIDPASIDVTQFGIGKKSSKESSPSTVVVKPGPDASGLSWGWGGGIFFTLLTVGLFGLFTFRSHRK